MDTLIKNPMTKTRNTTFKKCMHQKDMTFNITNDTEYNSYIDTIQYGIDDFCPECQKLNTEYGMIKKLSFGEYDWNGTTYIFNHSDIKKVVRYCWINQIPLHTEHYHINSMYDCTGKCHVRYVDVKRGKKVITVTITRHYDL